MFDYSRLRGRIIEEYGSQGAFAAAMGLSAKALSEKLNGKRAWKQGEMILAMVLLKCDVQDIPIYFFKVKVQNFELSKEAIPCVRE